MVSQNQSDYSFDLARFAVCRGLCKKPSTVMMNDDELCIFVIALSMSDGYYWKYASKRIGVGCDHREVLEAERR